MTENRADGHAERHDQDREQAERHHGDRGCAAPAECASTRRISGHVATTIIVAQMNAARNGERIHSEPAISPPMNSTDSVTPASSERRAVMALRYFTLAASQARTRVRAASKMRS